jgi:hypothetical protein
VDAFDKSGNSKNNAMTNTRIYIVGIFLAEDSSERAQLSGARWLLSDRPVLEMRAFVAAFEKQRICLPTLPIHVSTDYKILSRDDFNVNEFN